MTLEERVKILEDNFKAFTKLRVIDKFYTDADINGTRQSVSNITPYTETKKAYYGEKEKTFYNVPNGNVSVFFSNYNGSYSVVRIDDILVITFDILTEETDITISILVKEEIQNGKVWCSTESKRKSSN